MLPALHPPDWTLTFLIVVILAGFPLAVILAWAFELTPEGIKRDAAVDPADSVHHATSRRLDFITIGLLVVAVLYLMSSAQLPRYGTMPMFSSTTERSIGHRVSSRTPGILKPPKNTGTASSHYGSSAVRRISARNSTANGSASNR